MRVTLVAPTPKEAYQLAYQKYTNFKLISAKQIYSKERQEIVCEIKISIDKEEFLDIDINTIDEVKGLFIDRGVGRREIESIISPLDTATLSSRDSLSHAILQKIDSSILIKEESVIESRVKVFVGSTGVGKTTTVAKLAHRYSDMGYSVALVNLDNFKVGAFEQLAHFATRMGLEYFPIESIAEFEEIYSSLDRYDIILVDTAGISPYDTKRLISSVEYLSVASGVEITLVVSATIKYSDLEAIDDTFSFLSIDNLIVSKFDETRELGTIISYLLHHSTPLSYFTVGQSVPDDIILADREYILDRFIG
jgi:flagellar biosynthesis protein FlhF